MLHSSDAQSNSPTGEHVQDAQGPPAVPQPPTQAETLALALAYRAAGLSVILIKTDGSKSPLHEWKVFQAKFMEEERLKSIFGARQFGLAIIGGKVSGNLEQTDFDYYADEIFPKWRELVEKECPGLVARLSVTLTPRGGFHVRYRCTEIEIPGNLKLAEEPYTNDKGKPAKRALIETRGEGGYALAPGCPPECHPTKKLYVPYSGPPITEVPTITAAEREFLIRYAKSFDKVTPVTRHQRNGQFASAGNTSWEDFDRRGDWHELLEPHGWAVTQQQGDVLYWRRPDKDGPGCSATTGYCKGTDGVELLKVFSSNAHPFEAEGAYSKSAVHAILNHASDFKASARDLGKRGYGGRRGSGSKKATPPPNVMPGQAESTQAGSTRPVIEITTQEQDVNDQAVAALASDLSLFQMGGAIVRVRRDEKVATEGIHPAPTSRIELLPKDCLRERMAASAEWQIVHSSPEGEAMVKPQHPPVWSVNAVFSRGTWQGMRPLTAVVNHPVLLQDGSVLEAPGYDPRTGILIELRGIYPPVPATPSRDDAVRSLGLLFEIVADFPFASEIYRSAWLAAFLTPVGRFAFPGPSPCFLIDGNVPGTGKGLLADIIALAVSGERFTVATYTNDEEELRKRITSIVIAGDRHVLFDNLNGRFGNAILDAALTATSWKDRLLGGNRMIDLPMSQTFFATGNNVPIWTDTARRICHVRLESPLERPETRTGFRHEDLRQYVRDRRGELLVSGITILRAYINAGRPSQGLPAWGSYEQWSDLIRSSIVWAGGLDPGATRIILQSQADVAFQSMGNLLSNLAEIDPNREGRTGAQLIDLAKTDGYSLLRDAIEALCGRLDGRILGTRLRSNRRRIINGLFLDRAGESHSAVKWAAFPADEFFLGGESAPHAPHTPPDFPTIEGSVGSVGSTFQPEKNLDGGNQNEEETEPVTANTNTDGPYRARY